MERLTSPNINVDPDTDRFLHAAIGGKEIDWKQIRDSTLNVMINGPTSNSFGKDIFRKMARDLYGRLKAYEDIAELCGGFDRLRELAEADKDGRVVVMPCKFGDKLYRVFGEEIQEFTVSNIKYMGLQHRWSVDTTPFILYAENLIGTELFLAREEAARAIQEMEDKKDGKT